MFEVINAKMNNMFLKLRFKFDLDKIVIGQTFGISSA
jgi:hypothetical protein